MSNVLTKEEYRMVNDYIRWYKNVNFKSNRTEISFCVSGYDIEDDRMKYLLDIETEKLIKENIK